MPWYWSDEEVMILFSDFLYISLLEIGLIIRNFWGWGLSRLYLYFPLAELMTFSTSLLLSSDKSLRVKSLGGIFSDCLFCIMAHLLRSRVRRRREGLRKGRQFLFSSFFSVLDLFRMIYLCMVDYNLSANLLTCRLYNKNNEIKEHSE